MGNEENQKTGFPRFPTPLEIAPRFPHSHSPDDDSLPFLTNPRKEPSDSVLPCFSRLILR